MAQYNKPRKKCQYKKNIAQIKEYPGIFIELTPNRIKSDDLADGKGEKKKKKIKKPNINFGLSRDPDLVECVHISKSWPV